MTNATFFVLGLVTVGLVALFVFITVRRRFLANSQQTIEANRRFESTFEQSAVGLAHLDREGRWLRINRRFCEIAGYDHDELMQTSLDEITHPEDLPDDRAARDSMMAGDLDYSAIEKRYIRKDGGIVWVAATRSTVRDSAGRPEFFVAVVEEITARKEAETQLTSGEAQYRAIFDSAVEAMAVIDARGTIQSVNPSVERLFGYGRAELLSQNIMMLMPREISRHHDGYLQRYRDTGVKAIIGIGREVVGQRKDGTHFPLDLSVAEWKRDGVSFFTGVMRDVSARKDAEAALIAGEAQYRAIFDSAVEAMAVIDAKGTIQSVNPALEQTFGYAPEELLGNNIKMLMPKSIATHHDGYLKRYRDTGVKEIIGKGREVIGRRKDGTVFPLDLSVAEWGRAGETFFTGVIRDVSARKDAEAALIAGEAQYRAIFDSAVEAMAVIDAKGTIQSVNPALEQTFGYTPVELVGNNIKMLMPAQIATHHDGYLKRYRDTGVKEIIGKGREVIGRRKDGTVFPLDLSVAEWQRDGKTFFTGVMRDVSTRKGAENALHASESRLRQLQNEFAHMARVNDLGEMAAAIAHEINQPLTAIVNYLNSGLFIATEGYSEDSFSETEALIRQASQQALRAGDIVRRLREFIGHGAGVRSIEQADRLVDSAVALALIDARSGGIAVERIAGAGKAEIEADAVQIQQVLVNLLRNAVDAMRAEPSEFGPRLTISTALKPDHVEIAVADNGPGIEPDMIERLFEPFVTTKSKGMGMGLSVSRRLIEAHGGTIEAESQPGAGATFRFTLPQYRSIPA